MSDVSRFSLFAAVLLSLRNKRRMEEPGMDAWEEGRVPPVHSQQANNRKQQTDGENKPRTKRGVGRKMSEETVYKEDE